MQLLHFIVLYTVFIYETMEQHFFCPVAVYSKFTIVVYNFLSRLAMLERDMATGCPSHAGNASKLMNVGLCGLM